MERGGKKAAAAIHKEVTREIDTLLPCIFAERRKTGELDIEAVELALRTALHAAGAASLTELLRESGPVQTSVPCSCGGKARFKDMRLKPILTVLGPAKMLRAYYGCLDCRQGRFPADAALDIEDPSCLLGSAACWHWSAASALRSITDANRWNCWPTWRSPPRPWNA